MQASLRTVRDAAGRADLAATIAAVPELIAAGGTSIGLPFGPFCPNPADARGFFREAVSRFAAVG